MASQDRPAPLTESEKQNQETEVVLDNIEKSASVAVKNGEESIYCLSVIGQIEGHYLSSWHGAFRYRT